MNELLEGILCREFDFDFSNLESKRRWNYCPILIVYNESILYKLTCDIFVIYSYGNYEIMII